MNDGDAGLGFFFLIILAALYFLPAIIAGSRSHANAGAIFVLNLLLGWTFIGWVIALVWSFTSDVKQAGVAPAAAQPNGPAQKGGVPFARVDEDGEVRSIDREEYDEIVADLEDVLDRAEAFIRRGHNSEAFEGLADDLEWQIEALDSYEFKFRRTADRDAYRLFLARAGHIAAILRDAAEDGAALAAYDARIRPIKGGYRVSYDTARGQRLDWSVEAIGLSAVGEKRYLWLYSDDASGIRSFRLDRIASIEAARGGGRVEGPAVAGWLDARVKDAA